jgi:hypothetical protein
MNQNIKYLLEHLIQGDDIALSFAQEEYTHSRNISKVGGGIIEWIKIASIIDTWFFIEHEGHVTEYKKPIVKLDNDMINYTPSIIKNYIDKIQ